MRRHHVETDVDGALTAIPELVGQQQAALLLLNDGDLSYAKIRLDERSLASLVASIDTLDDSLARALCWGAAWDMTRDAELSATAFATLVLQGVATEADLTAVSALLRYAQTAVDVYSARRPRGPEGPLGRRGARVALAADAGSDHQLALVRALTAAAHSDASLDLVAGWYDGSAPLEGLSLDPDLRWCCSTPRSVRAGRRGRIAAEEQRDGTISGREQGRLGAGAHPDRGGQGDGLADRRRARHAPNETQRQIAVRFQESGDEALLAPYVERYLAAAETIWEAKGVQRSRIVLRWMFPRTHATQAVLDRVGSGWPTTRPTPGRSASSVRAPTTCAALAAQRFDAAG